jgi:pseudouridylate synthase
MYGLDGVRAPRGPRDAGFRLDGIDMEIRIAEPVRRAIEARAPIVALESTVLAHGLPHPKNLEVGFGLEAAVREAGAVPATIGVVGGEPVVGMSGAEVERFCTRADVLKLSTRDLPLAVAGRHDGATTVAATMWLAHTAGIDVFATGGIGGVHRGSPPDVSADLTELGRTPVLVVCAGAKSILDLAATREALESAGVLIVGWRTDRFPAFYSTDSGLDVDTRVDGADEMAALWQAHRDLGMPGGMLLCVAPPAEQAIPSAEVETMVADALAAAARAGVAGKAVTPFLLREIGERSGGRTLAANLALLLNNARVAGAVAAAIAAR